MTMRSTLGILLHIRKDKLNKKGEAPIFLRVTVNGKRAEISTKRFVIPEKWNSQAGQVKGTKEEIKAIRIYQKFIEEDKPISASNIKDLLLGVHLNSKYLLTAFKWICNRKLNG
ncbi:Arm DNA-binding domain-containing protein [Marinifilum fragile]|uniref:Arm DNA-binding domain-containing protein n=1 Tax=Marinifilum fragile TaxID=570161 RepID=UPI002AA6D89B|nr:Arm DNA-binding domain-containing protein [Marinifilum fragile]